MYAPLRLQEAEPPPSLQLEVHRLGTMSSLPLNLPPRLRPFSSPPSSRLSNADLSPFHPSPTLRFPPKPKTLGPSLSPNTHRRLTPLATSLTAGNPDDPSPRKSAISSILSNAGNLFDELPQPVKSFPWARTLKNFVRLVLDLVVEVVKHLTMPVLVMSQLSELSYCLHQRKIVMYPIVIVAGIVVAGVLRDVMVELSFDLKEGTFPRHLVLIALFFVLLKLPGPYYPYWGRLVIPQFANGGLWRTAWFAFMWYKGRTQSLSPDGS